MDRQMTTHRPQGKGPQFVVSACLLAFGFLTVLPAPQASAQVAVRRQLSETQFDSWVFQGNVNGKTADKAIEQRLELQLDYLNAMSPLSDDQKAIMRLAGEGDIKRFMRKVRYGRQVLKTIDASDNQAVSQAYQLARPLAQQFEKGLFGETSLFHKAFLANLSEEQSSAVQHAIEDQERADARAINHMLLAMVRRDVPMTQDQYGKLTNLLDEAVPRCPSKSNYALYYVGYFFSRVPDESLEAIFEGDELAAVKKHAKRYQGYKNMLVSQGLMKDDE